MAVAPSELWTIEDLSAQVALALAGQEPEMPNARVREVPDLRTIRYYTTLGMLDRPLRMRGRTALYGPRHLLQLVAIKRLQARGDSLAQVQQRLVGLTDAALRKLAQLPATTAGDSRPTVREREEPTRRAFWSESPSVETTPAERSSAGSETEVSGAASANLAWQTAPLEDGVLLLVEAARALDGEDLEALRAAAAPLLKLLHTRRLRRPRNERGTP